MVGFVSACTALPSEERLIVRASTTVELQGNRVSAFAKHRDVLLPPNPKLGSSSCPPCLAARLLFSFLVPSELFDLNVPCSSPSPVLIAIL